jgi:hypothetical protein
MADLVNHMAALGHIRLQPALEVAVRESRDLLQEGLQCRQLSYSRFSTVDMASAKSACIPLSPLDPTL